MTLPRNSSPEALVTMALFASARASTSARDEAKGCAAALQAQDCVKANASNVKPSRVQHIGDLFGAAPRRGDGCVPSADECAIEPCHGSGRRAAVPSRNRLPRRRDTLRMCLPMSLNAGATCCMRLK